MRNRKVSLVREVLLAAGERKVLIGPEMIQTNRKTIVDLESNLEEQMVWSRQVLFRGKFSSRNKSSNVGKRSQNVSGTIPSFGAQTPRLFLEQ